VVVAQPDRRGVRLKVANFKPCNDLNPELNQRYAGNRLRLVPELIYSPHGYDGRIVLMLLINGLPVATL